MDGRLEREKKLEESLNKKLERLPKYVSDWNRNMKASRKTAATRKDFIFKTERFLSSINPNTKSISVKEITEQAVTDYMLSIQTKEVNGNIEYTSDSYQKTVWACLNNFLGYLYERGKIETNYMKYISNPKNHDLDRINEHRVLLTSDDFKKILKSVSEEKNMNIRRRDMAILLVFMNTGIRRGALSCIMMNDVDLLNGVLTVVDKGNKRHQYYLSDEVKKAISDWYEIRSRFLNKGDNKHLFLSEQGKAMSNTALDYVVKKYTKRGIGVALSAHKIRAGYCSILYNKTKDIEFVRRAVGHSSSAITQRYIVTGGVEKKKAADIMNSILTSE